MNKPIRILQIVSSLNQGSGVLQVILNWHKNIDRTKIQFDYLYFKDIAVNCKNEIESLGGKCHKLPFPSLLKPWIFIKAVNNFFKTYKYNIIHSHITNLSFFFYPVAKLYGVKNIIQHSHNPTYSDKFLNNLINTFLFFFAMPFITKKIACSDLAGKFLFKKDYTVIDNGIDTEKFKFNQELRNKFRKELNIENKFIIGSVGRFEIQKNFHFLIEIFNEIYKQKKNSVLLLVGDGSLRKDIEKRVQILNLTNCVKFLGVRNDVERIYQGMDAFVLPSLFEGLGIVAIEAQCSGLPCFVSDVVPDEAIICNAKKISLNKAEKEWASFILEKTKNFERKDCSKFIEEAGFNINNTTKKMQKIYLQLNGDFND